LSNRSIGVLGSRPIPFPYPYFPLPAAARKGQFANLLVFFWWQCAPAVVTIKDELPDNSPLKMNTD
jgi:hypothetical protein